jgi:hypothetical protein
MENETPFISIYPAYGGYAVRAGEDLHCTADLDHVLRIVHASLTELDETDTTTVEQAVKRTVKSRS